MKLNRFIYATTGVAMLMAAIATDAIATPAMEDAQSNASQVQFVRLHSTAVAFSEALAKVADRYGSIQGANLDRARDLIVQSEQAAERNNFAQASQQAKNAYELLRATIMEAVAKSRTIDRASQK